MPGPFDKLCDKAIDKRVPELLSGVVSAVVSDNIKDNLSQYASVVRNKLSDAKLPSLEDAIAKGVFRRCEDKIAMSAAKAGEDARDQILALESKFDKKYRTAPQVKDMHTRTRRRWCLNWKARS